jgi:hypothetical protein
MRCRCLLGSMYRLHMIKARPRKLIQRKHVTSSALGSALRLIGFSSQAKVCAGSTSAPGTLGASPGASLDPPVKSREGRDVKGCLDPPRAP